MKPGGGREERPVDRERDWEAFQLLLELWRRENPIKTTKLQFLLAVNAGLVAALWLAGGSGPDDWTLPAFGAAASLVWTLSIGRTVLYQKLWQQRLRALQCRHPADARFQVLDASPDDRPPAVWLRLLGAVPSRVYLLGAPVLLCLFWLGLLVRILLP